MKKISGFTLLFLCISLFSYAQVRREVFAPFVSRIRVSVENGGVQLTWKDTDDVAGTCIIYRHTEEIDNKTFKNAVKVGEVPQETGSFIDYPEEKDTYYYAILIRDTRGKTYELFIPFRNKTTKGITLDFIGTEDELAATVTNIETQIQRDSILVTFDVSDRKSVV